MALGVATKAVKQKLRAGTRAVGKTIKKQATGATKSATTAAKSAVAQAVKQPTGPTIGREAMKKVASSESLGFSGAMNFLADAPSPSFGSASIKNDLKSMGTAISKNFEGGGSWAEMGAHAVRGAAIGGAVGAGVNLAKGEDAWDGAARGAVIGGVGTAAHAGAKMSLGAKSGESLSVAAKRFNQSHQAVDNLKGAASYARASGKNMSKDVNTLVGFSKSIEQSSKVTNGGFRF